MSFHQNSSHWVPGLLSFKPLSLSFFTSFQLHCHPPKPPCQLPPRLSPATAAAARFGARHWPQRRRRQRRRRPELWSEAADGMAEFLMDTFHHQETQSRNHLIEGFIFLALLFNNNSNNNHNLGKTLIPPNLECKKENRSLYGAKHGAFHCSPHPQINLQPKWESQICCFRSSFSTTSHLFSQVHMSTGLYGAQPTNFRYERLVHPITLPTCAAKFFSGPQKIYRSLTQVVLHGHFLGSFGCFISHLGKRSFFWYRSLFLGLTWDIQKMKDPKSDYYLCGDGKMSLL